MTTHPLDDLPRLDLLQEREKAHLRRDFGASALLDVLRGVYSPIPLELEIGPPDVHYRAAGMTRPGAILQFDLPDVSARVALGLEPAIAHAAVDMLLGYERTEGQGRLQVTPVEWGLLAFLAARVLERLVPSLSGARAGRILLDRVSPDPFPTEGLGSIVTLRFPVRAGKATGYARLWVPASFLEGVLASGVPYPKLDEARIARLPAEWSGVWRAEGGEIAMPRGLGKLRAGSVLPLSRSRLQGVPRKLSGRLEVTLREPQFRSSFEAEPTAQPNELRVSTPISRQPSTREPIAMSLPTDVNATQGAGVGASDLPVTLVVELGRVNLPIASVADLKPGDVVELGRHAREQVELTSGGRLVARGELVQIDTELGVRVLSVFL